MHERLEQEPTPFFQHYVNISNKYDSVDEIYKESSENVKTTIRRRAEQGRYKYKIYIEINPELNTSPFIHNINPICKDIIRFRLGSHFLPIETGRWSRTSRSDRLCVECGVLGDERHALYFCPKVKRVSLPSNISDIWSNENIVPLFIELKNAKLL